MEHWWKNSGKGLAAVERRLRCPSCGTQSGSERCVLREPAPHTRAMPVRLTQSGEQQQELLLGCGRRGSRAFDGEPGVGSWLLQPHLVVPGHFQFIRSQELRRNAAQKESNGLSYCREAHLGRGLMISDVGTKRSQFLACGFVLIQRQFSKNVVCGEKRGTCLTVGMSHTEYRALCAGYDQENNWNSFPYFTLSPSLSGNEPPRLPAGLLSMICSSGGGICQVSSAKREDNGPFQLQTLFLKPLDFQRLEIVMF